jgi:hypothetical protein
LRWALKDLVELGARMLHLVTIRSSGNLELS